MKVAGIAFEETVLAIYTPGAREKITTNDQARLPLDQADPWAALEVPTDGGRA